MLRSFRIFCRPLCIAVMCVSKIIVKFYNYIFFILIFLLSCCDKIDSSEIYKHTEIIDFVFKHCFQQLDSLSNNNDSDTIMVLIGDVRNNLEKFQFDNVIENNTSFKFKKRPFDSEVVSLLLELSPIETSFFDGTGLGIMIGYTKRDIENWKNWYVQNKNIFFWYRNKIMLEILSDNKPIIKNVPDKKTAIKIAVAVWNPIYGKETIKNEKPYNAVLLDGIWYVTGSLPKRWKGGVAEMKIIKENGKIIKISHGK